MRKSVFVYSFLCYLAAIIGFSSCKKKEDKPIPAVPIVGNANVKFSYVYGASMLPWELNKQYIHSKTGDTMTFTMFRFFVSNIKLKRADGTWWAEPESYYLLDASSAASSNCFVSNIPDGEYTALEYTMGVDSIRNVSGAQTGALSLQTGMFWDWNTGYIMMKAEGNSPQSSTGKFALHFGGFSSTNNTVVVKTADFGKTLKIGKDNTPTITLVANPARLWHSSPGLDSISVIHMPGANAVRMSKDFYDNISLSSIQ
ncbi:hypothetical protein CAP35_07745 [Chitinophagaceae bacterium IBVUCB1]|nr:hypothetical protein CAP35_07745 [Chitinophagaceae bacterium IBVUCB1]